jgi:hypothetical protein
MRSEAQGLAVRCAGDRGESIALEKPSPALYMKELGGRNKAFHYQAVDRPVFCYACLDSQDEGYGDSSVTYNLHLVDLDELKYLGELSGGTEAPHFFYRLPDMGDMHVGQRQVGGKLRQNPLFHFNKEAPTGEFPVRARMQGCSNVAPGLTHGRASSSSSWGLQLEKGDFLVARLDEASGVTSLYVVTDGDPDAANRDHFRHVVVFNGQTLEVGGASMSRGKAPPPPERPTESPSSSSAQCTQRVHDKSWRCLAMSQRFITTLYSPRRDAWLAVMLGFDEEQRPTLRAVDLADPDAPPVITAAVPAACIRGDVLHAYEGADGTLRVIVEGPDYHEIIRAVSAFELAILRAIFLSKGPEA